MLMLGTAAGWILRVQDGSASPVMEAAAAGLQGRRQEHTLPYIYGRERMILILPFEGWAPSPS